MDALQINELDFQDRKKAFHHCVIPAITAPAHAADESMVGQQGAGNHDWRTDYRIRVVQQATVRPPVRQGHRIVLQPPRTTPVARLPEPG
jgi:hypothetical protein